MRCNYCGNEINEKDRFCRSCGHKIENETLIEKEENNVEKEMEETLSLQIAEIEFRSNRKSAIWTLAVYFSIFYVFVPFFLSSIIVGIYCGRLGIDVTSIENLNDYLMTYYPGAYANMNAIINLITYVALTISIYFISRKVLKRDFALAKTNCGAIFKEFGIGFGIMMGASIRSGMIINFILFVTGLSNVGSNDSANQTAIEMMLTSGAFPLLVTILMTVFLAPFVEEMVFRKSFFNCSRKKGWKTILISGAIFGAIHVTSTIVSTLLYVIVGKEGYSILTVFKECIYFLNYFASGIALGYIYYRSKHNIWSVILVHSAYNLFAVCMSLLSTFIQ